MKKIHSFGKGSLLIVLAIAYSSASLASVTVGHEFAVAESGAATISVPIQVPRGIGGIEPQLALNYSSQGGNGLLGVGWNLSGPSAITRCAKTRFVDGVRGTVNFKADNDRFCLDGQRLVLIEGATYGIAASKYVTERDNFADISANGVANLSSISVPNTPEGFTIKTKSGLIMEYGGNENSQVRTNIPPALRTANRQNTINRWVLRRIGDLHGNFVEFVYCGGRLINGGCSPDRSDDSNPYPDKSLGAGVASGFDSTVLHYVRYTNRGNELNGQFAVMFSYEDRPDRIRSFHEGSTSQQSQRLKAVETYREFQGPSSAGALVRRYRLDYEPIGTLSALRATNASRLTSITELDAVGTALPPLSFVWSSDRVLGKLSAHSASQVPANPPLEQIQSIGGGGSAGGSNSSLACGGVSGRLCP